MFTKKIWLLTLALGMFILSACGTNSAILNGESAPAQAVLAAQETAPIVEAAASLLDLQQAYEQVYQDVNPSVVNIQVISYGGSGFSPTIEQAGEGSGFVWDRNGNIVTNAHVVEGASDIQVAFSDGSIVDAELVGADPYSDLAVIQVDAASDLLHPVKMAHSNEIEVGQIAIAVGNPFGLQGTMTQGIISGLSRSLPVSLENALAQSGGVYSIPDIIQTDASINPGNSGGVLVDIQGRVIGVTTAIASATQSNSGVGFVIPAAIVEKYVPSLIKDGRVAHAWMGISGTSLTPDLARAAGLEGSQRGALVLEVISGGPAQNAGIRSGTRQPAAGGQDPAVGGDIIIAIDAQKVERFEDMVSYLYNQTDPEQIVTLTILRDGQQQEVALTLGKLPD